MRLGGDFGRHVEVNYTIVLLQNITINHDQLWQSLDLEEECQEARFGAGVCLLPSQLGL